MAKAKKKSLLGYILFGLVIAALVLVIVGMCVDVIRQTSTIDSVIGGSSRSVVFKLFDDIWNDMKEAEVASNVFMLVSFIVTLVGVVLLAVDGVLRLFANKNCKYFRILAAAVTLVGAILILVSGLTTAGALNDKYAVSGGIEDLISGESKFSAVTGIWLGFAGGLVGAIAGALPVSKKFA